jgi:hypothetical protein
MTGAYDSASIGYNVRNAGGSPTGPFVNQLQLDIDRNGYDITRNASVSNLDSGQESVNETVVFNNVPFGLHRIRVMADETDVVNESDESDNVREFDVVLNPPDPGFTTDPSLGIWADRTNLRVGERTTIHWDTGVIYPLDSSVDGPGFSVSFDPSVDGPTGQRSTGDVLSDQEYALTCVEPSTGVSFTESVRLNTAGDFEEI